MTKAFFIKIFILNVLDGLMTLLWINLGIANEMNPLMSFLLFQGPEVFFFTKILIVGLGLIFLWKHKEYKIAVISAKIAMTVYILVCLWHITNLIFLVI